MTMHALTHQTEGAEPAGNAHIGATGGNSNVVQVSVVMTTHAAYVAGDFVGVDHTPLTFAGCGRINGGTGVIQSAVLVDYAALSIACELWLFHTAPAGLGHDDAAFTIDDADALNLIGIVPFSTYYASALNTASQAHNLGIEFKCGAASTSLFGAIVTRGAPGAGYASGDLKVALGVLQD